MMRRATYEAAWRLLEMIGNDRGPMLSRAAAEFRACLLREHEPEKNRPPPENPYFQGANLNVGALVPKTTSGREPTGDEWKGLSPVRHTGFGADRRMPTGSPYREHGRRESYDRGAGRAVR